MPDPALAIPPLEVILMGGVLGTAGQGLRAIVELKKANETKSATTPSVANVYITSQLIFSLLVGFVIGVVTTLILGVANIANFDFTQPTQIGNPLLTLLLAGYAGTDAVEGFVTRFLPSGP